MEMLAKGFGRFLPDEYPYSVPGASRAIKKKDFNDMVAVLPVADPNIFSAAQRITLAQTQLQLAQSAPQMHNMYEAYYRVYAALNVRDIDGILRPQSNQMPKDPASENSDLMDGMQLKAFAGQQHDAHIAAHLMMGLSPLVQGNPLAAVELQKHIMQHIRLKAEEVAEAELFMEYGADPDRVVSAIQKEGLVALKVAQFIKEARDLQTQLSGEGPDPVIKLKEAEIQQRAQADAQDGQIAQQKLAMDQQRLAQDAQIAQQRINSQENIAMLRADIAQQKAMQPRMPGSPRRNPNAA
jgi:hypothetical protein